MLSNALPNERVCFARSWMPLLLELRLRPKSSDTLDVEIIWLAQSCIVHDNRPREGLRRSGERRSGERRSGERRSGERHNGAMTDDGAEPESLKKWRPGTGSGNARARTKEMRKEGERRARDKELRSEQRAAEAKARAPPKPATSPRLWPRWPSSLAAAISAMAQEYGRV